MPKDKKTSKQITGQHIRSARAFQHISQGELAALVKVTRKTISLYETGAVSPTLIKFVEICNALDISPDETLSKILKEVHG